MLTAADVRRHDANAAFLGVPTSQLMANAGKVVAEEIEKILGKPSKILVAAGLGNNGGDGMVAARHLARRHEVRLILLGRRQEIKTREARGAFDGLRGTKVAVEETPTLGRVREILQGCDVVLDSILGIGIYGKLREPIRGVVKLINASKRTVVALDVPTGLGADLAVRPTVTVTLDEAKRGMTRANSGKIVVREFGIPPEAKTHCGPGDLLSWWRPNPPGSHKGENGRLLVVAGGPYGGAPVLASRGALRAGIDIVRLYTPRRVVAWAHAASADLIVHSGVAEAELVPKDLDAIGPLLKKVDAVLAGPGLGRSPGTQEAIRLLLRATQRAKVPLVLDADAHAVAGKDPKLLPGRPVLLTPHAGEFQDFSGKKLPTDRRKAWHLLAATARRTRTTILLKGAVDGITDGTTRRENYVHHPAMTRGGTGDVLAGVCGAFVARGASPLEAASAASFLVGRAGQRLVTVYGHGLLASDLPDAVALELASWTKPLGE